MTFAPEITEFENKQFMDEATFIIAENNDLCRLGLKCVIHDQIQSPSIHFVSTKLELHSTMLSNSDAVVIIDFDSLAINTIDEITVLFGVFPAVELAFI